MPLNNVVELLVEEVGKLLLRCDIMVEKLCKEAKECLMRILADEQESDKGGEKVECRNYTLNMCPAVGGNEKICPNCEHKEWVWEYKKALARVQNELVKEHYIKYGI